VRAVATGATILVAALFARSTPADVAADLRHCASVEAPDVRLACYDALARRSPTPPAGPVTASAAPPATATSAVPLPPPAPASPTSPAPGAAARNGEDTFGLSAAKLHPVAATGPDSIQATVSGISFDQTGHAKVRLDNGQAWAVSEPDADLQRGQPVTIKRASLGSYLLVTADRHSYRVRRTE